MPMIVIAAAAAVASGLVLLGWAVLGTRDTTRDLIATNLQRGDVTDLRELTLAAPARERAVQPVITAFSRWGRRLTPGGSLITLERRLVLAGRPAAWPLERILAAKVVLGGLGAVIAVLRIMSGASLGMTLLMIVFAALLYVTPDVLLSARAAERQRAILTSLPDGLDQMTICMEAGLGFEAAMTRTAQARGGPLTEELIRTLQEIQVGVGRRQALRSLADRTDVADLRHFVNAVLQAEGYGVPIAHVLRTQAAELRRKRRARAEEAARKLPLKLLIPLVIFVLPPLFIILVGPSALQLYDSFATLN